MEAARPWRTATLVTGGDDVNPDRYDAATLQMEKRFKSGNSLTAQYTRSSLHDKLGFLNPQDGRSHVIHLTDQGRELRDRLDEMIRRATPIDLPTG